jgi:GDP-4-dehydro-6-deoxy-D-mannose reductase
MFKRVLITGITGMAGSHLADLILESHPDCQVFGAKRWRSSLTNIEHCIDRVKLVDCNLTDACSVMELIQSIRPDCIFHLAAQSFVQESWHSPQATVLDNISMQINLFEAIRHTKIDPVVQIALSSEQYGKVDSPDVPLNENHPFRPLSPYAVSKVAQDLLAYQYHQSYGLKVIRTRAFNHEGPRRAAVFATSNFAKQIAEIEAGLKPPVVYVGNLSAQRDYSDVRDVVRAYWLAVQRCQPGEDYVIASGKSISIGDMLNHLLSLSHVKIKVEVDPARHRPSDVQTLRGDATKFVKQTGWQPEFSFDQTLKDLLDWWRERVPEAIPSKVQN